MSAFALVIAETCNWCSRQLPPSSINHIVNGQRMCHRCREWHLHALSVLSGNLPRGCQECGLSARQISEGLPVFFAMYVVVKDGIYQVLCRTCCDEYVLKRADLFRNTEFGERLKTHA